MNQSATTGHLSDIEYDELSLEVSVGPGGQREVRVLDAGLAGRARELFEAPYTAEELGQKLSELDHLLLQSDSGSSRRRSQMAESIGEDLFRALFRGSIGEALRRKLDQLYERQKDCRSGLRIRLSFGQMMRSSPEIVGLPWELITPPDRSFSVNSPETPLVRHLDLVRPGRRIEVGRPIRVLAILASPSGLRSIDLGPHEEALEAACERDNMELEIMWRTPLNKLRSQLQKFRNRGKSIHVLHFLGHGDFDSDGIGGLNFERSDGSRDRVPGRSLGQLLSGCGLQLAVLNTCVGGRMMIKEGQHPFAGSASALVAADLPAVVGMQFSVSEAAAIRFAKYFYPQLAAGSSVEEAVTEGRLAMLGNDSGGLEWASPVLFLRAPDGVVTVGAGSFSESRAGLLENEGSPPSTAAQHVHSERDTYTSNGPMKITRGNSYEAGRDIDVGDGSKTRDPR
ncbi:MAG: CHAT domain-containing protein [Acidobacteriota bacterium]